MDWPPKVGELLPRAGEAFGVRTKLTDYSLEPRHLTGGPKARGFELMLGITVEAIDYVEAEIYAGILTTPISSVRANPPFGTTCIVELPLRGLASRRHRIVNLRTVWLVADPVTAPRLTSAFLKP